MGCHGRPRYPQTCFPARRPALKLMRIAGVKHPGVQACRSIFYIPAVSRSAANFWDWVRATLRPSTPMKWFGQTECKPRDRQVTQNCFRSGPARWAKATARLRCGVSSTTEARELPRGARGVVGVAAAVPVHHDRVTGANPEATAKEIPAGEFLLTGDLGVQG